MSVADVQIKNQLKEGEGKIKKENSSANPLSGKIIAIFLTIIILIIGTFFYFFLSGKSSGIAASSSNEVNSDVSQKQMASDDNEYQEKSTNSEGSSEINTKNSNSLFNHILQENRIFTKRDATGSIKLFYYYKSEEPIDIQLKEGNIKDYQVHTIGGQKYYPLIIGYEEAKTMREEGLFNNIGDPIKNFYGKNVVVVGVMKKLDNAFDMIHITPLNSGELN